jgi:hypothetical protein
MNTLFELMNQMNQMNLIQVNQGCILHCEQQTAKIQFFVLFGGLNVVHRCSFGSLSPFWSLNKQQPMNQMNMNEGRVPVSAILPGQFKRVEEAWIGFFWLVLMNLHSTSKFIQVHFGRFLRGGDGYWR